MDDYVVFALSAFGTVLGWLAVRNGLRGLASKQWLSVKGEIVESSVQTSSRGSHHKRYGPRLVYRYEVKGESYENWEISFSPQALTVDRADVEAYLEDFPVGQKVDVYYDHRSPHKSVLEPGGNLLWSLLLFVFAGICFAGAVKIGGEL